MGHREKVTGIDKLKTISQYPNWYLGIKTGIRARLGNFDIYSLRKIIMNACFLSQVLGLLRWKRHTFNVCLKSEYIPCLPENKT